MGAEQPLPTGEDDQPIQGFLTYRLSRVQTKLNAQAHALLQPHDGLTLSKWRILALVGAAGETRLSDLSRSADLDKGLLSRNLKSLIEDTLVASNGDKTDQRVQRLSLTPKGRALFDRVLPRMRERQARLRAALTVEELEALESALPKLEAAADWRGNPS